MPYINPMTRSAIDKGEPPLSPGELNYVVTQAITAYLGRQVPLSYDRINAAIGVLECAKLELYRRVAAPYENQKCEENGDVY